MKNPFLRTHIIHLIVTASLAVAPVALAVEPPPDGGYPDGNTAEGEDALLNFSKGRSNTALGFHALLNAHKVSANTAVGAHALENLTVGGVNTAVGASALSATTTGYSNTATGQNSLLVNTTGSENTASGLDALFSNTTGARNTAYGDASLLNVTTGSDNIALGYNAGWLLKAGNNNIDIGAAGLVPDSNTIRIGEPATHQYAYIAGISGSTVPTGVAVIVDADGHLGTITSSARFKDEIKPMDRASEAILALQPVTFRYKKALDPKGISQFGLVAEQVEKVNPDLVACDDQGKPYTVRYEAVNAMLLNEFLKEHRKVEEQNCKQQKLEATVAQQQKVIEALTVAFKVQAAQIQKVSDQLRAQAQAPLVVANE